MQVYVGSSWRAGPREGEDEAEMRGRVVAPRSVSPSPCLASGSREPRPHQEGSGCSVEGGAWLLLVPRGQSEAGRGPPRLQDAQVLLGFQPAGC